MLCSLLAFLLLAWSRVLKKENRVTDLNSLQADPIGKVNCTSRTFALDADQTKEFADFAGTWMTVEAFGDKWVNQTGDTYGGQLAMQIAGAALSEACNTQ